MSVMTPGDRDALLAEARIAVLAAGRDEAGPLLAPIWYTYSADEGFVFNMGGSSAKARRLRAEGRATVCIHADDAPYRYVIAEGPVTLEPLREETKAAVQAMAARYLGPSGGANYAKQFKTPDEVRVTLTPERWQAVVVDGK